MGRRRIFDISKYVKYDEISKASSCIQCNKKLKGRCTSNIKRHYLTLHKINISEEYEQSESQGTEGSVCARRQKRSQMFTTMNKNEFLLKCVGLVTVKSIPFRIFDDNEFFKKIIQPYEQLFELNLNSKNIVEKVNATSTEIKKSIAKIVNNNMVCLKVDIASRMDKSILGINIQHIKNFKIHIYTLGMIQLKKKHTAQFIKEAIINCLSEYNIDISQIYSNTTDNGANVLKASKLLQELQDEMQVHANDDDIPSNDEEEYEEIHSRLTSVLAVVRCAAHTIQLAAHDSLREIESKVDECRKAVKSLRTLIRGGDYNTQMPILDNTTRWNSTFDMIKSLVNLKNFIECSDFEINVDVDWNFTSNFLKAFQPISTCTKRFQDEQYVLGDFYRDWLNCEIELEELKENGNLYAKSLLEAMHKRKEKLLETDAFISAIYLDPRFNFLNSPFLDEQQKKVAVGHLLKTYEITKRFSQVVSSADSNDVNRIDTCEEAVACSSSSSSLDISKGFSKLEEKLISLIGANKTQSTQKNIKQKLENLSYNERVPFHINILDYWKSISHKDPDLTQLAEIALAVPATQVSVERAFSALTTILTKTRSKLSNKTINNILIIKLNHNCLNEVFIEDL